MLRVDWPKRQYTHSTIEDACGLVLAIGKSGIHFVSVNVPNSEPQCDETNEQPQSQLSRRTELFEETKASPEVVSCVPVTAHAIALTAIMRQIPVNMDFIFLPSIYCCGAEALFRNRMRSSRRLTLFSLCIGILVPGIMTSGPSSNKRPIVCSSQITSESNSACE